MAVDVAVEVAGVTCRSRRLYWHIRVVLRTRVDPAAPMSEGAVQYYCLAGELTCLVQAHSRGLLLAGAGVGAGEVEEV